MKSDTYTLSQNMSDFHKIPDEAEKVAKYNSLSDRQSRRLRLLAEELISMLPELLAYGHGEFWIENKGNKYELHVSVTPDKTIDIDRDKILSVSKSGKNAAAKGILNKIIVAAQLMMADYSAAMSEMPEDFYSMGMTGDIPHYTNTWTLNKYREKSNQTEDWDELEKSIIANLADDVIVGITGYKVEIIVKKSFDKEI